MALDVETAAATLRSRLLATLVGVTAITVALLTLLESDAGRKADEASIRAARLSLDIFGRIATSGPPHSFESIAIQEALTIGSTASSRIIAALEQRTDHRRAAAFSAAERRVGKRMGEIVAEMTAPPAPGELDETARTGVTATIRDIRAVLEAQNQQVDEAERFGTRQQRAVFALTVVAVAAVLLGVVGLTRDARAARASLVLAAIALAFSLIWGGTALFI